MSDIAYQWVEKQEAKLSLGQPTVLPHTRLSSNSRLLRNIISSCSRDILGFKAYWDHEFHLSRLLDAIGHVTIRFHMGYFLLVM